MTPLEVEHHAREAALLGASVSAMALQPKAEDRPRAAEAAQKFIAAFRCNPCTHKDFVLTHRRNRGIRGLASSGNRNSM